MGPGTYFWRAHFRKFFSVFNGVGGVALRASNNDASNKINASNDLARCLITRAIIHASNDAREQQREQ